MRANGGGGPKGRGRNCVFFILLPLLLLATPLPARGADFWQLWPPAKLPEASVQLSAPLLRERSLSVGIGTPAAFILHGRDAVPSSTPEAGLFMHRALGGRGCFDFALGIARTGTFESSLPLPDLRTVLRIGIIF